MSKKLNIIRKQVTFTFKNDPGKELFIAGSFNNWYPKHSKLTETNRPGIYSITIMIARGRHKYDLSWNSSDMLGKLLVLRKLRARLILRLARSASLRALSLSTLLETLNLSKCLAGGPIRNLCDHEIRRPLRFHVLPLIILNLTAMTI